MLRPVDAIMMDHILSHVCFGIVCDPSRWHGFLFLLKLFDLLSRDFFSSCHMTGTILKVWSHLWEIIASTKAHQLKLGIFVPWLSHFQFLFLHFVGGTEGKIISKVVHEA